MRIRIWPFILMRIRIQIFFILMRIRFQLICQSRSGSRDQTNADLCGAGSGAWLDRKEEFFHEKYIYTGIVGTLRYGNKSKIYLRTVLLIRTVESVWLRASRIRKSKVRIRIRILLSSSKNCKKNLESVGFVTSLWLFIFEKWCKCTFKK
jgi:MFS-type transporter involved in bile tolerance (Atg22 family)